MSNNGLSCNKCNKTFVINAKELNNFGETLLKHCQNECRFSTDARKVELEEGEIDQTLIKEEPEYVQEDIDSYLYQNIYDQNYHEVKNEVIEPDYASGKNFKCKLCTEGFDMSSELEKHFVQVHERDKYYACNDCEKVFERKKLLQDHKIQIHGGWKCEQCGKIKQTYSGLNKHIKAVHVTRNFSCNFCDMKFKVLNSLQNHFKTIHEKVEIENHLQGNKIFKKLPHLQGKVTQGAQGDVRKLACIECSETYENISDLTSHILKVHLSKNFQRIKQNANQETRQNAEKEIKQAKQEVFSPENIEVKKSNNPGINLNLEQKFRSQNRKTCPECKQSFKFKNMLKTHVLKVHNGWKCDSCGKSFTRQWYVKVHKREVHENTEKQFSCNTCDKQFKNINNLRNHVNMFHNDVKNFKCDLCGKAFSQKGFLNAHKNNHSKRKIEIPVNLHKSS